MCFYCLCLCTCKLAHHICSSTLAHDNYVNSTFRGLVIPLLRAASIVLQSRRQKSTNLVLLNLSKAASNPLNMLKLSQTLKTTVSASSFSYSLWKWRMGNVAHHVLPGLCFRQDLFLYRCHSVEWPPIKYCKTTLGVKF